MTTDCMNSLLSTSKYIWSFFLKGVMTDLSETVRFFSPLFCSIDLSKNWLLDIDFVAPNSNLLVLGPLL